jgi:hypothetical protein
METNMTNPTSPSFDASAVASSRPSSRRGLVAVVAGTAVVVLLAVSGCTSAQRQALGEQDVRDALSTQVDKAFSGRGLSRDGNLDCASTIGSDSKVSATCTGAAKSGEAVTGSFTGTADVNAETCIAQLTVKINGNQIVDQPGVDCFKVK